MAKEKKYKVTLHDLSIFSRQLVTMFDAGVALHEALDFYAEGEPGDLGLIIREVATKISGGVSLSHAFRSYPKIFSPVFCGLVQAGERTGELSTMLHNLTNLLEEENRLSTKIRSALTYPAFLVLVSFAVACIFMYVIMPALEPMLMGLGVRPPWPTQVLILMGTVIRHPVTIIGVPTVFLTIFFKGGEWLELARKNPKIGERLDWIPMNLPIIGDLFRRITLARVLFTIATTIEAGLSLTSAIDMGRSVTANVFFQRALDGARAGISDGDSLAESLQRTGIFPEGMVQMIAIGEETASLSQVLSKTAEMYSEDASHRLETSVQLMEPILLFGMGIVSGFLVLAAILPLVKMIDSL